MGISWSLELSYSSFSHVIAERISICSHVFSILIEDAREYAGISVCYGIISTNGLLKFNVFKNTGTC